MYTAGGNINLCGHYGKLWRFSKKLKIELPYDPAIPLLGIDPLLAISTDVENKLMVTGGKEKG